MGVAKGAHGDGANDRAAIVLFYFVAAACRAFSAAFAFSFRSLIAASSAATTPLGFLPVI